ncbi:MAG: hypothetical protein KatS3mg077_2847 [Candidatus Binatia bacterium]|nr:MAG: hypothetical protein KatS3mg077_2847 [Candidatus Binatia bacterium]
MAQLNEPPPSFSNKQAGTLLEPQVTFAKLTAVRPLASPVKAISASFTLDPDNALGQAIAMHILPGSCRFPCARHPGTLNTRSLFTASNAES